MSRFALEFKPGVFVANINARVRDKIWDKIEKEWNIDSIMIYTTDNEQGFDIRKNGDTRRKIMLNEGIILSEHLIIEKK